MSRLLLVSLGGALGTGARYLVSTWTLERFGTAFPWGTLAVNVVGSLLLGAVMHFGLETEALSPTARIAIASGVLGGFTTYSSFSYETLRYLQTGEWSTALVNVAVTLFGCLGACWLGWAGARWLVQA
jgi:CrcB protein